jgi:molybdopterin converting factor subunit 1
MRIKVLLFARVRELAGTGELLLELPKASRAQAVLDALFQLLPELPSSSRLKLALNEELVGPDAELSPGDIVAIVPPLGGG